MSSQRLVRLKAEMTMMSKNPVPGIHCWLKEANSDVIMVEMDGPAGSPYENGIFKLEVVLSDRYPFTPPNVRFLTPVYHPNIDPNGRICLSALKPKPTGSWAVTLNIAIVLSAIRILLAEPNLSDPLMTEIASEYAENYEAYRAHAEEETSKHAKKISKNPGEKTESVQEITKTSSKSHDAAKEDEAQGNSSSLENPVASKKLRLE